MVFQGVILLVRLPKFFRKKFQSSWTIKVVPKSARTVTIWRLTLLHIVAMFITLSMIFSSVWGGISKRSKQEFVRLQQLNKTVTEQKKQIESLHSQREEMKSLLYETTQKMEKRHAFLKQEDKALQRLINQNIETQPSKNLSEINGNKLLSLQQYALKSNRGGIYYINELRQKIHLLYQENEREERKIKTALERVPTLWPVNGELRSFFGYRTHPVTGGYQFHNGVDIVADYREAIKASASGVVSKAGWEAGYGNVLEIEHGNGFVSKYAHCSHLLVSAGSIVKKGEEVALVGSTGLSTGPHLHYEIHKYGQPIDPVQYLNFTKRLLAEVHRTSL